MAIDEAKACTTAIALTPEQFEIVVQAIAAAGMPRLLSPAEAAELLHISTRTLFTWTEEEDLPFLGVNGQRKYPLPALQRWVAERTTTNKEWAGERKVKPAGRAKY